jgi:hypothetical protein
MCDKCVIILQAAAAAAADMPGESVAGNASGSLNVASVVQKMLAKMMGDRWRGSCMRVV